MRIVSLFMIVVFSFSNAVMAEEAEDYTGVVRGVIWDIRPVDIEEHEAAPLITREDQALFYRDDVYDRESTIGYQFKNNKLHRIRIDIYEHYTDVQDWIALFMDMQRDLSKKWGTPLSEDFIWYNDYEKNFPDHWGAAVFKGDLEIVSAWADQETLVTATLKASEKYHPAISIVYEKRLLKKPAEESMESQNDGGLGEFLLP